MRKLKILLVACSLIAFPHNAQASISNFIIGFDQTGYYNYAVEGLGLTSYINGQQGPSASSGTLSLDVPGAPQQGFVYWHGYGHKYWQGYGESGNPNVTFNGNPIAGTPLVEAPGGDYGVGYWADVTSYLSSGAQNYTIDGVSFTGANNQGVHNGFGVLGIYNDPSQYGRLIVKHGNDYAFHGFTGNNGPSTRVLGFNFDPADYDRQAEIAMIFAGGQDGVIYPDRRSYIWHYTGTDGIVPANLVDEAYATQHPDMYPLFARDGYDWDTYFMDIFLPANSSVLALQVESDDEVWNGESFSLVSTAAFIPQRVIPEPATISLLGMGIGGFLLKRKKLVKS